MNQRNRHLLRSGLTAGVLTGALALSGCHGGSRPATATPSTSAPAPAAAPAPAGTGTAPTPAPADTPAADKVPGTTITGTLLWNGPGSRLYRVRGSARTAVLSGLKAYAAELSPDGRHLVYVDESAGPDKAVLMVARADGSGARKLRSDVANIGYGPSWSPDGTRILTARRGDRMPVGTIRVSDGRFTALPKSLQDGVHHRWTGDGERIVWTSGDCKVMIGRSDGTGIRRVPVLGDENSSTNPRKLRVCDIVSTNRDGSRITAKLSQGDDANGDIGGSQWASAVIDTTTGKPLPLPVRGSIDQALYRTDGTLLVHTQAGGKQTLTLLSRDDKVLARMPAPAGAKGLSLHDYAR